MSFSDVCYEKIKDNYSYSISGNLKLIIDINMEFSNARVM